MAPPLGGPGAGGRRARLGGRGRRPGALPRCRGRLARPGRRRGARGRGDADAARRPRLHGAPSGRGGSVGAVRPELDGSAQAAARDARRRLHPDRERGWRAGPARRGRPLGVARGPGARAHAAVGGHGGPARVRAAAHRPLPARPADLDPDRRDDGRRRRPRPSGQGRAGPAGRPALARRARRAQRPPAAGGKRPREHDLRLPARRPDLPGCHPGAPRPGGRPPLPDRGHRRDDRSRRGRGGGRRAGGGAAGQREGPGGARDRRALHPGAARARGGRGHRGAPARGDDPALRPAPGDRD